MSEIFKIDSRETKIINELTKKHPDIKFNIEKLDFGDFKIKDKYGNIFLIERKAMPDFRLSITSGRLTEQFTRLLKFKKDAHIIYLVEGKWPICKVSMQKAMTTNIVKMLKYGIHPIFMQNISQTAYFLKQLFQYGLKTMPEFKNSYDVSLNISKIRKKNINGGNIMQQQLMLIPGVSVKTANSICKKYNKLSELMTALKNDKFCLSEIKITKRKIGKKISERIANHLL